MREKTLEIYYISLEKDYERRESLHKIFPIEFDKMNYIKAVDGRELKAKEYFKKLKQYYDRTKQITSPGEIGCVLSHISAINAFLKSDNEFALILEDDIIGDDGDIQKVKNITHHLNDNSLIHCGGMDGRNASKYILGTKSELEGVYKLPVFSQNHLWRACSYLITRKSAQHILDVHKEHALVADNWSVLLKNSKLNVYASNIFHHPEDLTNSNLETFRKLTTHNFSVAKVFRKLRNIFYALFYKISGYIRVFPY